MLVLNAWLDQEVLGLHPPKRTNHSMNRQSKLLFNLSLTLVFFPLSSFASINFDKIASEVKGFLGDQLTRAYCMVKKDCHQRVIYLINASSHPITLNGCHFSSNQILPSGDKVFTARKNSKGHACELTISQEGKTLTVATLSPRESTINYKQQNRTLCLIDHRVLKSWHKCPWGCGKYEVHGYIGACAVV